MTNLAIIKNIQIYAGNKKHFCLAMAKEYGATPPVRTIAALREEKHFSSNQVLERCVCQGEWRGSAARIDSYLIVLATVLVILLGNTSISTWPLLGGFFFLSAKLALLRRLIIVLTWGVPPVYHILPTVDITATLIRLETRGAWYVFIFGAKKT